MSYNIEDVKILSAKNFGIWGAGLEKLYQSINYEMDTPESCFLHSLPVPYDKEGKRERHPDFGSGICLSDQFYPIDSVARSGTYSGASYITLFTKVLPLTVGEADIVYIWEDGDLSGVQVRDGVVTRCEVVMSVKET